MLPCTAISVFALYSLVASLHAYTFDEDFQPFINEQSNILQREPQNSLESLSNDQYLLDPSSSSSKEGPDEDLESPRRQGEYFSLWDSGMQKLAQGDSRLLETAEATQGLGSIPENPGFDFANLEYLSPKFLPSKRSTFHGEMQNEFSMNPEDRVKFKRSGHSLSIVNPLDVLRQRMLLDMARQRMAKNKAQIQINDSILQKLGKRSHNLTSYSFSRRDQLSPGEKSAQRKRRQRREYINDKQVPVFQQVEV